MTHDTLRRASRAMARLCGYASAAAFLILAFMYGRLLWLN